jgi:hypothetical protein
MAIDPSSVNILHYFIGLLTAVFVTVPPQPSQYEPLAEMAGALMQEALPPAPEVETPKRTYW